MLPVSRCEDSDRDRYRKEKLRETRVGDTDRRGLEQKHGSAAEQALSNDSPQRKPTKLFHPRPLFDTGDPNRQDNGQRPDDGRDHAVAGFEEHTAGHLRDHLPVRQGPVGHRKPGFLAGDGRSSDDQEESAHGDQSRVSVQPGVLHWVRKQRLVHSHFSA